MGSTRSRKTCCCRGSTIPSSILFLSWILPTSSFAQIINQTPTTFSTSTTPSSNTPSAQTESPPSAASSSATNALTTAGDHAFNYYFLLVGILVVLFFVGLVWCSRRKRRKAAIMRSQSQRALARDVEGWRTRFRAGLGGNEREEERQEGLDERGEAPPPYKPGSKPPSVRRSAEGVEMTRLDTRQNPPGYHESPRGTDEDTDIGDITRPRLAVTAPERSGSARRLLDHTGSFSQA